MYIGFPLHFLLQIQQTDTSVGGHQFLTPSCLHWDKCGHQLKDLYIPLWRHIIYVVTWRGHSPMHSGCCMRPNPSEYMRDPFATCFYINGCRGICIPAINMVEEESLAIYINQISKFGYLWNFPYYFWLSSRINSRLSRRSLTAWCSIFFSKM